jgi:hypothetical protein
LDAAIPDVGVAGVASADAPAVVPTIGERSPVAPFAIGAPAVGSDALSRTFFGALCAFGAAPVADRDGLAAAFVAGAVECELEPSAFVTPLGDLRDAFCGRTRSADLVREAARLAARGFELARRDAVGEDVRRARDMGFVRGVVRALRIAPAAVGALLEEFAADALDAFCAIAISLAADESGAAELPDARAYLAAMSAARPSAEARGTLAESALLLALEPAPRRFDHHVAAIDVLSSPWLLRLALGSPELATPAGFAALARRARPAARAGLAWLLARAERFDPASMAAALDHPDAKVRITRAASCFGDVHSLGRADLAGPIASSVSSTWPAREVLPLDAIERAIPEAEARADFLAALGDALRTRAPDVSLRSHEAAFQTALSQLELEADAPMPHALPESAARSAATLAAAGQGAAVAEQLQGTGAQLFAAGVDHAPGAAIALWAELTLRIARIAGGANVDATPFYAALASIGARGAGHLGAFGAAAPVLARALLYDAFSPPAGAAEPHGRHDGERHLHDLAVALARKDAAAATSAVRGATLAANEPAPALGSAPLRVALEAVEGVDTRPASSLGVYARALSGAAALVQLLSLPLRALGYRRAGRLEVARDTLVLEETTHFFGQKLRARRHEIATRNITAVERVERAPAFLLVLGLVILIGLTWFGISVAFDGFAIGDPVLVVGGIGAVLMGLAIDGSFYAVFRRARGATRLRLQVNDRRGAVRLGVPRADADRVMAALRALRISEK